MRRTMNVKGFLVLLGVVLAVFLILFLVLRGQRGADRFPRGRRRPG